MKEFFLGSFLSCNKLNIVKEQNLKGSKALSKRRHLFISYGIDQFIGELFRREIDDTGANIVFEDMVSYGI